MPADTPEHGLILIRASRLEALLGPLLTLLDQTRPAQPLAPQTVVAAHPGMKQWLTGALARQVGPGRIVANLDVILPSAWLDTLASRLLGARAVALPQYRRAHLRWTLYALLEQPQRHGLDDPRVLAYLDSSQAQPLRALRRFQLADRLARVYSQYLAYRGDWLLAWEAGKTTFATARSEDPALRQLEAGCLAPLWRSAATALGEHRARLVGALETALRASAEALPPLHVFGLSHLPPAELAVLQAYARHAPVLLYVPDPCREYWGGLRVTHVQRDGWVLPDTRDWQRFRADEDARLRAGDASSGQDVGHPLLARWGRLGQHFFATLVDGELREDIRHFQDNVEAPPGNRLQRLQESIRRLQPEFMAEDVQAPQAAADASLRIHACHTRLRELEVLRDALLDALEQDPSLTPGEMVVMAPDIRAYLPLIPAVFGEPGSARERLLPYHLADVPVAGTHPLRRVFERLLAIGNRRITLPEVADLLDVDAVRRGLGLALESVQTLLEWLRASGAAWALDAGHKADLGLPAVPEYSFAWAMERLLAGYVMGGADDTDDPQALRLADGSACLPVTGVDGPDAAALGGLSRLLAELQTWRGLAQLEQRASDWAELLRERVDALLRVDPQDAEAQAALAQVHRAIAGLRDEPARNGEDPLLPLAVVREVLLERLDAVPERQPFLLGGVTFCGMVPQRAIPFRVVCVLGLNEGDFPRRVADGGIDLMAHLPRLGDRDVISDDRYLFLETVMSARDRLHLSYLGQGVRDGKPRNPAAPLAELLAELDAHAGIAPDDEQAPRPWLVRHPLQPFDARYFDGRHPALFSYSQALAAMQGDGDQPLPRLRAGAPLPLPPLPERVPLAMLERFFKNPAESLLRDQLQLTLDGLDTQGLLREHEPLDQVERLHTVARRVFLQQALPRACADPDWHWDGQMPDWVRYGDVLPPGAAGLAAWQAEARAVTALLEKARQYGRFDARAASGAQVVTVDVTLPPNPEQSSDQPLRIAGTLRTVFPLQGTEQGVQLVFAYPNAGASDEKEPLKAAKDLTFKECVPAFLQWALLRLHHADDTQPIPVRLTVLAAEEPEFARQINAWDAAYCEAPAALRQEWLAGLQARLWQLVSLWRKGCAGMSWLYPKTASALLKAESVGNEAAQRNAVNSQWLGSGRQQGERDYAPGWAQLLEGDLVFGDPEQDPDGRAWEALRQDAHALHALLHMQGDQQQGATP
ncbi:MAG: exodeoxyribonuclease V subunit gamma [Thermomonas hydrothermalis]|uniref:exodeoxyribonuclease V subunit gamma n=1 Tax=Thermomonas hydrothermalis TaxID=213588 RepID=UPI0023553F47|nr:exodeoxyribonuclease V subunit gamma [Thermomonas hydrothermalis]MCL6620189.1 exodeoxyribonuclease V subunit gamma [Thermomonas hydrothermalis]